jgi:ATP-dependent phosphofructokinase / diphosphate-dependent phosphofructokinase
MSETDRVMAKRIGLLTSGGDCAGLNAVIRAVVHRAAHGHGWTVLGIRQGTHGLLARPVECEVLEPDRLDQQMMRQGGTILGTTNTGNPFAFALPDGRTLDRSAEVIEGIRILRLDALIGVGGDGSLGILRRLAQQGRVDFIGIPKTIDNDVGVTEAAIGYNSAVRVATEALDNLQPTAASHSRIMVLETMGRDAGHIALAAGIAGGADVILIPEIPYRLVRVAEHIHALKMRGRNFALVVVAEAVKTEKGDSVTGALGGSGTYGGVGHYIARRLAEATGAETRITVLGHVQRGASPGPSDRVMASIFGVHAVDMIAQGRFDRMVAWRDRRVVDVPLAEVVDRPFLVDIEGPLVRTARGLGISFGD